jgi:DNA polymerase-3 subunit gamma/tau
VLAVVARMAERAPDFGDALADMLLALHSLTLLQTVPNGLPEDVPGRPRLEALAQRLTAEDVQLFYQIALTGRRDLPLAPDPRTGFEMTLLRMLAFRPVDLTSVATPSPTPLRQAPASQAASAVTSSAAVPKGAASAPQPAAAAPAGGRKGRTPGGSDNPEWSRLAEQLDLNGMARQLAMHCDWGGRNGDKITLRLAPSFAHMRSDSIVQRLEAALADHFGAPLKLEIELAEPQRETPAERVEQERVDRQRQAVETIERDPNVAAMRETFAAELVPNSIEPIN